MKISQEHAILIKNLYLSKQHGAQRLLSELPDKNWKLKRDTGMEMKTSPVPFPQDPVKT